MATQYIHYPNLGGVPTYATAVDLPASAQDGALAITLDTDTLYVYNAGMMTWLAIGTPGDVLSVGMIDSNGASANGASINASSQLIMQSASATVPGLINNTTQTLSGNKTLTGTVAIGGAADAIQLKLKSNASQSQDFLEALASDGTTILAKIDASGNITGANLSGTNTGNVTLTAVGSSPSANGASLSGQALTLQPADATHPGLVTTGTQTIAGNKALTGTLSLPNLVGTSLPLQLDGSNNVTAAAINLSGAQVTSTLAIENGGTGQTTASAAFNALSPLTTKGDLLAYSTTNARLPVGTDGQVLTADSGQTLGVKWNTPTTSVTTIGSFDGQAPSANGLVISGASLFAQSADATHPGMVNNTTQTMSGAKTFTGAMVAGGAAIVPKSIFDPVRPMTSTIAAEMGEAVLGSLHYHALFAIGLILFLITLCVNIGAEIISRRYRLKLGLGR